MMVGEKSYAGVSHVEADEIVADCKYRQAHENLQSQIANELQGSWLSDMDSNHE